MHEQNLKKRCVIYCRVSTPRQAQEGESLEAQEAMCRRYAAERDYEVSAVFKEPFTGSVEHRPEFKRAIDFIKKDKHIDYMVVRFIDRFTRGGTGVYERMKKEIRGYGAELIDCMGIIQPSKNLLARYGLAYEWSQASPSDLSETMSAEMAKIERQTILMRLIPKEIELIREGYHIGPPIDGYVNQKITVGGKKRVIQSPNPDRAHFFTLMFQMRASGEYSDRTIVEKLNAIGYRTAPRNRWSEGRQEIVGTRGEVALTEKKLQLIISNPIYCGVICRKWTNNKPVVAKYPGIVSVDLFNQANRGKIFIKQEEAGGVTFLYNQSVEKPVIHRNKNNPKFPYRAIVVCPHCKKPFVGSESRGKNGNLFAGYHCSRGHKYFRVKAEEFHKNLESFISELHFSDEFFAHFKKQVYTAWEEKKMELETLNGGKGNVLDDLKAKRGQAIDALIAVQSDSIRKDIELKIQKIEEDIRKAEANATEQIPSAEDIHDYLEYAKKLVEHPHELLLNEPNQNKKQALFSLVFPVAPTYLEIVSRTPQLSTIFDHSLKNGQSVRLYAAARTHFIQNV